MLSWLKDILGDGYTDEIDKKISQEIGKSFVARADFNTKNEALKNLEAQIGERDKQLEELKKSTGDVDALKAQIAQLQSDNAEALKNHEAMIKNLKINAAVDMALMGAKAKNTKAVKALLDLENAELDENGAVKGLDEQLKKLAKAADSSFLFETASGKFKGFNPNEGSGDPPKAMTLDAFRKLSPSERFSFSQKNPDEYKKLYEGD